MKCTKLLIGLFAGLLFAIMPNTVSAQEFEATFQLRIHNKYDNTDTTEVAYCTLVSSVAKGRDIIRTIQKNQSSGLNDYDDKKVKALERLIKETFKRKKSRKTGEVTYPAVIPGMAVVYITTDFDAYKMFEVVNGKTYYSDTVNVMRIPATEKTKKRKRKKYDEVSVIDFNDGFERFKVKAYIPKRLAKDDSRLIFQIYAVDCVSDDTVAYLSPKVFEGEDYHKLQIKRKGYDYAKNDPLAIGYDSTQVLKAGEEQTIETVVIYKKPDKKRKYRGPYTYSLEDYHHRYYKKDNPGTCLRIQPLKFLDFSVAEAPLALDRSEFYEEPEMGVDSVKQNLDFKFKVGKAELEEDSTYAGKFYDLNEELRQVEDLLGAELFVSNSPEGGMAINGPLAQKRAATAASMIHMPRGRKMNTGSHVFTWEETANELELQAKKEENTAKQEAATAIRDALSKCSSKDKDYRERDKAIQALPMYEEIILPEMVNERKMTFTYRSLREHVKTPDEALTAYMQNKKKPLSWGDYYNVFDKLIERFEINKDKKDSLEIEELTRNIYKRLVKMEDNLMIKIAPYVINQMAVVQNRIDPDTTILKAVINDTMSVNYDMLLDFNTQTKIRLNRPEFILNQAVAFFKLQEIKRAKQMLQMLKQDINTYNDEVKEGVQRLEHFVNFKEQLPNKNRTDEQERDFKAAQEFIENSGIDNRAILYTELPEELGKEDEAEYWVDLMDDGKPTKWYLKGILWSKKTDRQADLELDDADMDTFGEVDLKRMGHYLGYFQHAFDMEAQRGKNDLMRYYFNEGHVIDEIRKTYPYKNAFVPVYRKIFDLRKEIDDEEVADAIDKLEAKGYNLEELGFAALLKKVQNQAEATTPTEKNTEAE